VGGVGGLASIVEWKTDYLEVSVDGWYLKLGHGGFFPRPLPFVIHYRTIFRGVFKTKLITFPKCILFCSLVYV
jgi:hypothetical protein